MHTTLATPALGFSFAIAIAGIICFALAAHWLFRKEAKKKQLAYLRKKLEETAPADPEYNQIRALYLSMMQDGIRAEAEHSHAHDAGTHHPDFAHGGHDAGGDFGGHH